MFDARQIRGPLPSCRVMVWSTCQMAPGCNLDAETADWKIFPRDFQDSVVLVSGPRHARWLYPHDPGVWTVATYYPWPCLDFHVNDLQLGAH